MCDRDKRQKNLMVIFNRSYLKMGDDLGIWRRERSWKSGKMTRERSIWGVGSLAEKMFRPLRRTVKDAVFENCHLLENVDENFMIALRENIRVQIYS